MQISYVLQHTCSIVVCLSHPPVVVPEPLAVLRPAWLFCIAEAAIAVFASAIDLLEHMTMRLRE